MSFASSHFAAAHKHSAEFFGETVTCQRPIDVNPVSVTEVTATPERRSRRRTDEGVEVVTTREIVVDESKLPGGFARIDMTWVVESKNYSTDSIEDAQGGFKCITLIRVATRQPTRKNHWQ